jgi:hypothetical protein
MLRVASLAALTLAAAVPAAAIDQPPHKHGLWETTTTFEGTDTPAQTFRQCTDENSDALIKRLNQLTVGARQEKCSPPEVQTNGNTTVADSVCKIGPTTITSRSVITSNDDAYTIKVTSTWEGGAPVPGIPAAGTSNMTIEAKRLGACRAGQTQGDVAPKR